MDKMVNSLLSAGVNPLSTPAGQLIGKCFKYSLYSTITKHNWYRQNRQGYWSNDSGCQFRIVFWNMWFYKCKRRKVSV